MQLPDESQSIWTATTPETSYLPLETDLEVDVAIVGGGLTGLVAAWHLVEAGRRVAVIEQRRIAFGETGHTTAHLTGLIDARYSAVERSFGLDGAQLVCRSSLEAIDWIEHTARTLGIDCDFERVPAFLYTERAEDLDGIGVEMAAARRAGLDVSVEHDVPLPFPTAGGMRIAHQAQFHPRRFLLPLAERIAKQGGTILESTEVTAVTDGEPCLVKTARGTVRARDVIVASHVPMTNRMALVTKLPAYRTYAIGVRAGRGLPRALFWDTDEPYHYTRVQASSGGDVIVVGGEDHKTGTEKETLARFQALADYAQARFDVQEIRFRWSGQIIEPVDGLPYIGRNTASPHVHVATGYSGNGMTWGTVAGRLTADLVLGRRSPYAGLYEATRVTPLASAANFVTENVDFPKYLVRDRFTNADVQGDDPSRLAPGQGQIVAVEGHKYAVHRDAAGEVHAFSPACTHMGCDVAWNTAEQTWDCPCHGSRFSATGEVLNGPAVTPLEKAELPEPVRVRLHHEGGS
jgi:glycine/D-amino acid oxidase-like deaminating enzyme/nitrite reductase/ring-hydroxylating ferredoxin subunit